MRRRHVSQALWLAPVLLSACAHRAASPPTAVLSGRLQLRVGPADAPPQRSLAAGFDYQGDAHRGRLALDGPLGARLAEARWDESGVVLSDAAGERRYASLMALAHDLLGEPLPLEALGDWLQGRPWPGAAAEPAATGFTQAGWQINIRDLTDQGLLLVTREQPAPALLLRIILDR